MKNFLERVASTVTQPQPRLRPLLGSIYAPAQSQPMGPAFAAEEVSSTSESQHPTSSGPLLPQEEPAARLQIEVRHESPLSGRDVIRESRTIQPLVSFPAGQSSGLMPPGPTPPQDTHSEVEHPSAQTKRYPHTETQLRNNFPYEPLLSTTPSQSSLHQATAEVSPNPASPAIAGAVTVRRSKLLESRPNPVTTEADEIHIHIGRIEVAAFTQPPQRATPAPPARKSLNLDEYLKRSNGRAQ